jgi:hypothetical protein
MQQATKEKKKTRHPGELHPGSITDMIYKGVKSGLKLSTSQWAKRLKLKKSNIYEATGRLRNMGFLIAPISTVNNPGAGEHKEGVLVDLSDNQEWFNEVYNKNQKQYVNPHTKHMFKSLEVQAAKNPVAAKEIRTMAFALYKTLLEIAEGSTEAL